MSVLKSWRIFFVELNLNFNLDQLKKKNNLVEYKMTTYARMQAFSAYNNEVSRINCLVELKYYQNKKIILRI